MRKLLVLVLVLVVLVVGADIAGRLIAQSRAATAISRQHGSTIGHTAVAIHGFSFLAQALPGHYDHISLDAADVTVGPITGIAATIELYDVRFPLTDALRGATGNLVAGRATVHGVLSTAAVTAAIPEHGATVSAGSDGSITVAAAVTIAGRSIPLTADLLPSFSGGVLRLNAFNIRAAGFTIPNIDQLAQRLSVALPLDKLPFDVQGATLGASGSELVLTATAYDVHLHAIS